MKPNCPTFDKTWRSECLIERTARNNVDYMIKRHYLQKWPGVCTLVLGMRKREICDKFIGVAVFALPPRETSKRYGGETWELARLWVDDSVPQNAETWLISRAVRYIKHNFIQVKALVSYADPAANHVGTIYKAANWISDGRTDQERKTPRFDYVCAITGKHYSRRSHVPEGGCVLRVPRVSKHRFVYRL